MFPATAMPDAEWWQQPWPDPGQVVADLGIPCRGEVVDLCCGDGLFTVPLARVARRVYALDLDHALLAVARERLAAAGLTNCELVEGDAYEVGVIVRQPVDFILIANTFHGVPEKTRLVSCAVSIMKPNAAFAVVNWHRLPREQTVVLGEPRGPKTNMRMEPAEVAAAAEPAGLHLSRVVELPPYHYVAIFEKRNA